MAIQLKHVIIEDKELLKRAMKLPLSSNPEFVDNMTDKEWGYNMDNGIDTDIEMYMDIIEDFK